MNCIKTKSEVDLIHAGLFGLQFDLIQAKDITHFLAFAELSAQYVLIRHEYFELI